MFSPACRAAFYLFFFVGPHGGIARWQSTPGRTRPHGVRYRHAKRRRYRPPLFESVGRALWSEFRSHKCIVSHDDIGAALDFQHHRGVVRGT
jgi:hypothetical protein